MSREGNWDWKGGIATGNCLPPVVAGNQPLNQPSNGSVKMRIALRSIATGLVLLGAFQSPLQAQSASCATADSFATQILTIVRKLANPADTIQGQVRSKLGISSAPDSEVVLILSDSLCAVAGAALDNSEGIGPSTRQLHVVKVGTSAFAVVDRRTVVHLSGIHLFSSSWVYKGNVGL